MRGGNIETFDAPQTELRPDEKGFAAFETAGRRVGVAYRQGAQDYQEIGRLQQAGIEARRWPFDILALQQQPGVSFRVGGSNSGRRGGGSSRGMSEIARGAGTLGGYLGGYGGGSTSSGGELIDMADGTTSIGRQTFAGTGGPNLISPTAPGGDYGGGSDAGPEAQPGYYGGAGSTTSGDYGGGSDTGVADAAGQDYGGGSDPRWFSGLGDWLGNTFGSGMDAAGAAASAQDPSGGSSDIAGGSGF